MNCLSPSIVLVKNIRCSVPHTDFDNATIELGAQLILQLEGVITPLILRREGIEHYHVIEGHLEYYAALRAREIDLSRGETINAYIIESDNEAAIIQQIELFKKTHIMTKNTKPVTDVNPVTLDVFNNHLQHLGQTVRSMIEMLAAINNEINTLQASLTSATTQPNGKPKAAEATSSAKQPVAQDGTATAPKPVKPKSSTAKPVKKGSSSKTAEETAPKKETVAKKEGASKKEAAPKKETAPKTPTKVVTKAAAKEEPQPKNPPAEGADQRWLTQLNTLPEKDLITTLTRIKTKGEIINALLKARPFKTLAELSQIKGLGEKTLERIKDALNK